MQHPEITLTEKFGSRYKEEPPEFVGKCACLSCNHKIYNDYEYVVDYKGNVFCTKECAELFYGLRVI